MESGVHLLIGRINSGKTHTIAHLLREANPRNAIIVSWCNYTIEFYKRNFSQYDISDNISALANVSDNSVVILDEFDCTERQWYYNKYINQLFKTAKHRGICFYLTMPYPIGIPPWIRRYFDSVSIYRESYKGNIRVLFEFYGNIICGTLEEFSHLMNKTFNNTDSWYIISYIHLFLKSESYTLVRIKR